jgi:hypothetical protein
MFEINQRVHRKKERQNEHGKIVELTDNRARILWDGDPEMAKLDPAANTFRPKRTWMNLGSIALSKENH